MQVEVEIEGKTHVLEVAQAAQGMWIASGMFLTAPLEVTGASSEAAAEQWRVQAQGKSAL